ncbi:MAG: hypothetical protein C0501_31780 [Isosphaera sp.]|nr:hypothetical protein [Isosphaera sp.]
MQQSKNRQQGAQKVVVAAMGVGYLLPAEAKPTAWTDKFDHGSVRVVLYVEQCPIRNSYRILVANRGSRPEDRQWFSADDIPNAIKSLQAAQKVHKKAKRYLEGGILRRVIRTLF